MSDEKLKIQWTDVLWTNPGIFLTAQQARKAVRDLIRTQPGECIRIDLTVYNQPANQYSRMHTGLHFQYRSFNDKENFERVLQDEHAQYPKAKFRVFAYKAVI